MHKAGVNEPWRHNRYSTADLMSECIRRGKPICPLLTIPGVTVDIFKDDWLHAVDQGVGADFLGNALVMVMRKLPGTKAMQAQAMSDHIHAFYDANDVRDRLKSFGWNNVQAETKDPPKLRGGNAASLRALIPFGYEITQRLLSDDVPEESACKSAAYHLFRCYECLSKRAPNSHEVLLSSSIAFALQYGALRDISTDPLWRVKPKMHRFLELCHEDCLPSLFWTYRDEDFGGTIAHLSKARGPSKRAFVYMQRALEMFGFKNPEPRLLAE